MNNVIVFGVSITAATIIDGIMNSDYSSDYNIIGFLDDSQEKQGKEYFGYKVIGCFNDIEMIKNKFNITTFLIGLADHRHMMIRHRVFKKCVSLGLTPGESIHRNANILKSANLQQGAFIMPNVYIGVNVNIGVNSSIHVGVSILEEVKIGNNVLIAGNSFIGGYAKIGDNVYIGPGCIIASGVEIESNTLIGAGSLVLKKLPSNVAAYGSPISLIKQNTFYI
jgi:sugar O-acyltransferase (sialic acid O-acetyltransferase NeuD family)